MRRTLTFIVTERCTRTCAYCYVRKGAADMSIEVARAALDAVLSDVRFREGAEGLNIDFIGGEPLLAADTISSILDYAHQRLAGDPWREMSAALSTNGDLYDTLPAQRLIATHRCLRIAISLDGTPEVHDAGRGEGSYAAAAGAVPLWLKQFPGTATKATISRPTLPHLSRSVMHLLLDLHLPKVNINPTFEELWSLADAKLYESELLRLGAAMLNAGLDLGRCNLFDRGIGRPVHPDDDHGWCGTGRWMLAVGPDGCFYPCNRFAPGSARQPLSVGNIHDGIDHQALEQFVSLRRRPQSPARCLDCEVATGCAWCKGHDWNTTGSIDTRGTSLCEMHRARVRAARVMWSIVDSWKAA